MDSYRKKIMSERRAAEIDSLTGIYNRYSAVPMIREYLHKHENNQCALVMMDLDKFKDINDHYGHECGDKVLEAFARKLEDNFNLYGFACRLGGDEFMGFLKNRSASFVEDFLKSLMKNPVRIIYNDEEVTCNMSAGYVMFPEQGFGYHDLYRKADMALYHAKTSGRNRFSCYDPSKDKDENNRMTLRSDTIINTIPGGLMIYRISDCTEILSVNDDMISIAGCSNEQDFRDNFGNCALNVFYIEDRDMVDEKIRRFHDINKGTNNILSFTCRITNKNKEPITANVYGRLLSDKKGDLMHLLIIGNASEA
jgi:diguanylate cyclase (GGDEF)-like protein